GIRDRNETGVQTCALPILIFNSRKDWMRHLFENHAQVLIATEAGGEGINLQFCNHLINYDLPWNPMRLEQRIGRIHRFGQNNDEIGRASCRESEDTYGDAI